MVFMHSCGRLRTYTTFDDPMRTAPKGRANLAQTRTDACAPGGPLVLARRERPTRTS